MSTEMNYFSIFLFLRLIYITTGRQCNIVCPVPDAQMQCGLNLGNSTYKMFPNKCSFAAYAECHEVDPYMYRKTLRSEQRHLSCQSVKYVWSSAVWSAESPTIAASPGCINVMPCYRKSAVFGNYASTAFCKRFVLYLFAFFLASQKDLVPTPLKYCIKYLKTVSRKMYGESCPVFCPNHYRPVCAASKMRSYAYRSFTNGCYLDMLNCRGDGDFSEYIEVPLQYCPKHAMKNIFKEQVVVSNLHDYADY